MPDSVDQEAVERALDEWVVRRLGMDLSPLSIKEGAEQIIEAAGLLSPAQRPTPENYVEAGKYAARKLHDEGYLTGVSIPTAGELIGPIIGDVLSPAQPELTRDFERDAVKLAAKMWDRRKPGTPLLTHEQIVALARAALSPVGRGR